MPFVAESTGEENANLYKWGESWIVPILGTTKLHRLDEGLPPFGLDGSDGNRGLTILHSSSLTNRFVVLMASLPGRALVAVPPHRMPDGLPKRRSVVAECSREGGVIHDERLFELVEHLDRLA